MKHLLLIIISIFVVHTAFSQNDTIPLVTDRPDRTESAMTVPRKSLQIESGFTFGWDKQEDISTKDISYNSTLFRYGLNRRLEFRAGLAFAGVDKDNEISTEKTTKNGILPLVLGFKWNILYGDGPIPTLAILSHVDIPPAASKDFSDGNVLQTVNFAGSWVLSRVFSFGFNVGSLIDWKESDFTSFYTASLGISIIKWMGAYIELYSFLPAGEYSKHSFDMGLIFPVRHNLQFDVSGGMGLSDNALDGFASCGVSWRIPN